MLPKVLPADKWASNRPFLLPAFPTPPILRQSPGDPQLPHSGQGSGLGKSLDREVGGLGILGQRSRQGVSAEKAGQTDPQAALEARLCGVSGSWGTEMFPKVGWMGVE